MIQILCDEVGMTNGVHEYELSGLNNEQVDFQFLLLNNPSLADYNVKIFGKVPGGVYLDKTVEAWDGIIGGVEENKNHMLRDCNSLTKDYENIKIQVTLSGENLDVNYKINYVKKYIR